MIFVVVTAMMLSGAKVRMDALHRLDTMYSQYLVAIRQIGELKANLEKMDGYLYHYVAVPSARNNTLASIKQETNSNRPNCLWPIKVKSWLPKKRS